MPFAFFTRNPQFSGTADFLNKSWQNLYQIYDKQKLQQTVFAWLLKLLEELAMQQPRLLTEEL